MADDDEAEHFLGAAAMRGTLHTLRIMHEDGGLTPEAEHGVIGNYIQIVGDWPLAMVSGLHQGTTQLGTAVHMAARTHGGDPLLGVEIAAVLDMDDETRADPLREAAARAEFEFTKTIVRALVAQTRGEHRQLHEELSEAMKGVDSFDGAQAVCIELTRAFFGIERGIRVGAMEAVTPEQWAEAMAADLDGE